MQNIILGKITDERYDVRHSGRQVIGTVAQDLWGKWEVIDANFNRVPHHSTIKAAIRVAARALYAELAAEKDDGAKHEVPPRDDELSPIIQDEVPEWDTWREAA